MPDKNKSFNTPLVDDEVIDFIIKHEGDKPYMYLDHKGNLTVGAGFHIPSEKEAVQYPFKHMKSLTEFGLPATRYEIEDTYRRVSKRPFGKGIVAEKFNPFTDGTDLPRIGIDTDYSREKARQKLLQSEKMLENKIRGFQTIPRSAQKAFLDMEYNMGDRKFRREYYDKEMRSTKQAWPNLFNAIEAQDWKTAAEQSHRRDVDEERNNAIRDLLLEADREKPR